MSRKLRQSVAVAKEASRTSYPWFVYNVFSLSFPQFTGGKYLGEVAKHLQGSNFTMDVTGRNHFKSTRLYCDLMREIFIDDGMGWECHYFSYAHELASYHTKKIKNLIKENPYFGDLKDFKPTAEGVMEYAWQEEDKHMTITPGGLLSFKRGIHAEKIYVDDPLRDPENKMQPTVIYKINDIMKREVLPFVNKGGYCRIVGTPQTKEDFFFDANMQERFDTWITGAIVSDNKRQALWPEWMSYDELMVQKRVLGESLFNQEFNAIPVYSEDSYLNTDLLMKLAIEECWDFTYYDELDDADVVAGFDIGKKSHPSHLAVFIRKETQDSRGETVYSYKQIFSKWMDKWDYNAQVDYLDEAIDNFNIRRLAYDNTRGEFESIHEQGKLPRQMVPINFGARNKQGMATNLLTLVETERISFIDEARMLNQMLAVTSNLDAIAGPEGHADSFWSIALALNEGEKEKVPRIRSLYS